MRPRPQGPPGSTGRPRLQNRLTIRLDSHEHRFTPRIVLRRQAAPRRRRSCSVPPSCRQQHEPGSAERTATGEGAEGRDRAGSVGRTGPGICGSHEAEEHRLRKLLHEWLPKPCSKCGEISLDVWDAEIVEVLLWIGVPFRRFEVHLALIYGPRTRCHFRLLSVHSMRSR